MMMMMMIVSVNRFLQRFVTVDWTSSP